VNASLKNLKILYWRIESFIFEIYTRFMLNRAPQKKHNLDSKLLISFTSYKPRFKKVHLTIKSLLSQSVKPDLIILWVSHADYDLLPEKVTKLEEEYKYFKIKPCDDLKSYKKLIPAIINYPEYYIVTADDDLFYPRSWLERLTSKVDGSDSIIAHRTHAVSYENGEMLSYNKWLKSVLATNNRVLFPTTGAGVIYPPNCFHTDVTNKEIFLELCPTADDIWFFWMAKLHRTQIIHSGYNFNTVSWLGTDIGGLAEQNVIGLKNDIYIRNLKLKYGDPTQLCKIDDTLCP